MKESEFADFVEKNFHLKLTAEMLGALMAYSGLLMQWNAKMNLTRYVSEDDIFMLHFADSLAVNLLFERRGLVPGSGARIADVGTGAGFPSLPEDLGDVASSVDRCQ